MRATWRPLVAAAVVIVVWAAAAAAQTVIVTKAPPGATVELVVNSGLAGTATADASGQATLPFTVPLRDGKTESDTYVFVEYCDKLRRVILIEPGMQGFQGGECVRREVAGVYVVRKVTTMVVDVSEAAPAVLLRQGPAPPAWLTDEVDRPRTGKPANAPSRGLYGFVGGGISSFLNPVTVACGNEDCAGSTKPGTFTVGATFWLTPYAAIEGSYLKPASIRLTAESDSYGFVSTLETDLLTMVGKFGVPLAYLRPYGFGGLTFSRASWVTNQTMVDRTITIDDVETVIPGGTQTFRLYTQGWTWIVGGGVEVPVSKRVSIYGEGGRAGIKGDDRQNGEGTIDDRALYIVGGIRIRILG